MFNCEFCDKNFINKGSLGSHQPYCKNNPKCKKRKISPFAGAKKGSIPWNKGLSTPEEVKFKISKKLKGSCKGIASTEEKEKERRKKISETMKKNPNAGGLRIGSGRGKKGWYKNVWCDSTWELAWVIYHIDNDVVFERNKLGFKYNYNNKQYTYYPDFKLGNLFIEIKGRRNHSDLCDKDKVKIDTFEHKLLVLYESDMKFFLKYAINKYGNNFHTVYEEI